METRRTNPIIAFLLDLLFHAVCLSCGAKINPHVFSRGIRESEGIKEESVLCKKCEEEIEINTSFFCPRCGKRLLRMKNECHPETKYILGSASSYKNKIIRCLIHSLKYNRVVRAAETLAKILYEYAQKLKARNPEFNIDGFIILPMPLHRKKERKRGFNQSLLILKSFNKYAAENNLRLTCENDILKRKKNTPSQTKCKTKEERIAHMNDAFEIPCPEKISGKNVIILDDVFTSGATMNEAVQAVKNAGAKKVIALVVAKT